MAYKARCTVLCFPGGERAWLFFLETFCLLNGKEVLSLLALSYYGIGCLEITKVLGLGLVLWTMLLLE